MQMKHIVLSITIILGSFISSGCTTGNAAYVDEAYSPVSHNGKYYQPYKVNLKGQQVDIVKGMAYSCVSLENSSVSMNIKTAQNGKSINSTVFVNNSKTESGTFVLNTKNIFELQIKNPKYPTYMYIKDSKVGISVNNKVAPFQCKLASNVEVMKYRAMSNQEIQNYIYNKRVVQQERAQTSKSIDDFYQSTLLSNQTNSMSSYQYQTSSNDSNAMDVYNSMRAKSNARNSSSGYVGSSGQKYKYDLSNPIDRHNYSTDLGAQHNDSTNLNRQMDTGMGQYGGGTY
jgi:hypothetical protein